MKRECFILFFAYFFLIFLGFISSLVSSQATDPCSSRLNLPSQQIFDTTSLKCINVWSPHGFVLRYAQAGQTTWNFVLSAPNPGSFAAIGFSPSGNMVGSSAIVGWVGADGTTRATQYFLGGKTPAEVLPDQGNLQLRNSTINLVYQSETSQIHMVFQLINTERPESRLLYAVGPRGWLPSRGNNFQLTQHIDMVSTSLDYATGQTETEKDPNDKLRRTHGILNILGWGILLPIGVMVARYLRKYDPLWFYSHATIQITGFSLGVAGVITGLVLNGRLDVDVDIHKGIGISILALGCLQVIALLARPAKESKVRKYWNWYHHTVGRILIILAIANIFYGIRLAHAGTDWNTGYAVALFVLVTISAILELRIWLK